LLTALLAVEVIGYLALGRSFAYVGVAPLSLYLGEIVLGLFALCHPRDLFGRLGSWMARSSPMSGLAIATTALFAYGIAELLRGLQQEYDAVSAIQNLVLNYYPFYILAGIWAALRKPHLLRRVVLIGAWIHGIYGLAYMLVLDKLPVLMPGTDVEMFGQPCGSTLFLLALVCFPASRKVTVPAMILNAATLVGIQSRAEWLAFLVSFTLWGILSRRVVTMLKGLGVVAVLLVLGLVFDFSLPGTDTRGGAVTSRSLIGRVLAPIDRDLATEYNPEADGYANTIDWRTRWWQEIWETVHADDTTALLGLGYGYRLGDLVPYLRGQVIRTPHNVFFYTLGYGGWLGVLVFFWFQAQIAVVEWRAYRFTNQAFGLVVWAHAITAAFFGNVFETPYWAVPMYIIFGMCAAPLLRDGQKSLGFVRPQAVSRHTPELVGVGSAWRSES
jgi:hypothetical protein